MSSMNGDTSALHLGLGVGGARGVDAAFAGLVTHVRA